MNTTRLNLTISNALKWLISVTLILGIFLIFVLASFIAFLNYVFIKLFLIYFNRTNLKYLLIPLSLSVVEILKEFKGKEFDGTICSHPFHKIGYNYDVPMLEARFVTTEQGTGIVHCAPSHGPDDGTWRRLGRTRS